MPFAIEEVGVMVKYGIAETVEVAQDALAELLKRPVAPLGGGHARTQGENQAE